MHKHTLALVLIAVTPSLAAADKLTGKQAAQAAAQFADQITAHAVPNGKNDALIDAVQIANMGAHYQKQYPAIHDTTAAVVVDGSRAAGNLRTERNFAQKDEPVMRRSFSWDWSTLVGRLKGESKERIAAIKVSPGRTVFSVASKDGSLAETVIAEKQTTQAGQALYTAVSPGARSWLLGPHAPPELPLPGRIASLITPGGEVTLEATITRKSEQALTALPKGSRPASRITRDAKYQLKVAHRTVDLSHAQYKAVKARLGK